MAEKARLFEDAQSRAKILSTKSPELMKKLGRQVRNFDPNVWDANCEEIVFNGNMAKFSQNPSMLEELMDTGSKTLVEASPFDTVWGIGLAADHANATRPSQWKGDNRLGRVLMRVRDRLREFYSEGGGQGCNRGGAEKSELGAKRARGAMTREGLHGGGRTMPEGEASRAQDWRDGVRDSGEARGAGSSKTNGARLVEGWGVSVDDWWAGA